jgi:cyclic pyranopterin phosphate synthase
MGKLTHFDESGKAAMVDVTKKRSTERFAVATGRVYMKPSTLKKIQGNEIIKGDVVAVAKVAGIMAAKRVDELIPLCHKLMLSEVAIDIAPQKSASVLEITCRVRSTGKTGVEMEALTGVTVAALTVYDMCKAIDREIVLSDIKLQEKKGGRSGHFKRGKEKGKKKKEKG